MIIVYTKTALKQMRRVTPSIQAKIKAKIEQYAEAPLSLANQIKKLKGIGNLLRLRVGDYRIIFTEDGVVMTVVKVGHRREIYN
jgi:mRNA interferase RelE/StbE